MVNWAKLENVTSFNKTLYLVKLNFCLRYLYYYQSSSQRSIFCINGFCSMISVSLSEENSVVVFIAALYIITPSSLSTTSLLNRFTPKSSFTLSVALPSLKKQI